MILIGESCTDITTTAVHERQSPENDAVPIYKVVSKVSTEGMAKIVHKSLDAFIITNDSSEIIKERVYLNGTQIARIDTDKTVMLLPSQFEYVKNNKFDHIAISDYGKGLLNPLIISYINMHSVWGTKVFLDPHPNNPISQYKNVFMVKLNELEAQKFSGVNDFRTAAHIIRSMLNATHVFITLGKNGMYYQGPDKTHYVASKVTKVLNVAGAGDVVFAAIINGFLNHKSIIDIMNEASEKVAAFIEIP